MAGKKNIRGKHVGHRPPTPKQPRKRKVGYMHSHMHNARFVSVQKKPSQSIKEDTKKVLRVQGITHTATVLIVGEDVGNRQSLSGKIVKIKANTIKKLLAGNAKYRIVNIDGDDVGKNNSKETDQGYVVLADE